MSCACNPFYPNSHRREHQRNRTVSTTVTIDRRFHDAVIFDLDGVVTDTASIHAAAWAAMFNDFLRRRQAGNDEDRSPFTVDDYRHYVDGKPREAGVVDFLGSRGISLTPGSAVDSSEDTVSGLGARKQQIFLESCPRPQVGRRRGRDGHLLVEPQLRANPEQRRPRRPLQRPR